MARAVDDRSSDNRSSGNRSPSDNRSSASDSSGNGSRKGLSGTRAADLAQRHLEELTGKPVESVSGLSRLPDGWAVTLELVGTEMAPACGSSCQRGRSAFSSGPGNATASSLTKRT